MVPRTQDHQFGRPALSKGRQNLHRPGVVLLPLELPYHSDEQGVVVYPVSRPDSLSQLAAFQAILRPRDFVPDDDNPLQAAMLAELARHLFADRYDKRNARMIVERRPGWPPWRGIVDHWDGADARVPERR